MTEPQRKRPRTIPLEEDEIIPRERNVEQGAPVSHAPNPRELAHSSGSPPCREIGVGTSLSELNEQCKRAPMPPLRPSKDPLQVMLVDAVQANQTGVPGSATIHLFGTTKLGNTVLLRVNNFYPYFYIPSESGLSPLALRNALHQWNSSFRVEVDHVQKRTLVGYTPRNRWLLFFKITLKGQRALTDLLKVRDLLQTGGLIVHKELDTVPLSPLRTFEADMPYISRFMIDRKLQGCSWLTVRPNQYSVVNSYQHVSHAQLEVDVDANEVVALEPIRELLIHVPLRVMSICIQCLGQNGRFPKASDDSILQIAATFWNHGEEKDERQVIFTLGSCAPLDNATVLSYGDEILSYDDEKEMFLAWLSFLRALDPDIITGHYITGFEIPFIIERAKRLGLDEVQCLGKAKKQPATYQTIELTSWDYISSKRKYTECSIAGRVVLDTLSVISREHKLASYSLSSVCAHFLGEQTATVDQKIISNLQNGTARSRSCLARYTLKHSLRPYQLIKKVGILTTYVERAQTSGFLLGSLFPRGRLSEVEACFRNYCYSGEFIFLDQKVPYQSGAVQDARTAYTEPKTGMYSDAVAFLKFNSLVASMIVSFNLCHSTRLEPYETTTESADDVHMGQDSVEKGILPQYMAKLLSQTRQMEMDSKTSGSDVLKARKSVLNKLVTDVGRLPFCRVSIFYSREMCSKIISSCKNVLKKTKEEIEEASDFLGAEVISQDTEGIMVRFGDGDKGTAETCIQLGKKAAELLTKVVAGVTVEFQTSYKPFLLVDWFKTNKKMRYAGFSRKSANEVGEIDRSGLDMIRSCKFNEQVASNVIKELMRGSHGGAKRVVRDALSDLYSRKIDLSLLICSQRRSKHEKSPATVAAKKMKMRQKVNVPEEGFRVQYVTVAEGAKSAASRADDPVHVLREELPVDVEWYREKLVRDIKPMLQRAFSGQVVEGLVRQGVVKRKDMKAAKPKQGGINDFFRRTKPMTMARCRGCNCVIKSGAVCKWCDEGEEYKKHENKLSDLEDTLSELQTECRRCIGEGCEEVLCSNTVCPIFYRREKAGRDVSEAKKALESFSVAAF